MHQFTTSFSSLAKPLSPADSNEMSLHNAARKVGLTFDCKITYLEIPICTGYDDDGLPLFHHQKKIYIYEFLHLHWPGSKNAIESPSLFLGSATLCLRPKHSWMKGTWKRVWTWRKLGGTGETCCLTTRGILHLWTLSIQFQLPCMAPQLNPRKNSQTI